MQFLIGVIVVSKLSQVVPSVFVPSAVVFATVARKPLYIAIEVASMTRVVWKKGMVDHQ